MKRDTSKLFKLVKSLTKNEKRFFKLYSNLYNQEKDKNYLFLFELLDEMKKYNEEVFLDKIKSRIKYSNLSQVKTYLKHHIFLSLKLFHRKNSKVVQHYDDIGLANLLIERKEYEEAEKILNKMLKNQSKEKNISRLADIHLTFFKLSLARETLEEYSYKENLEVLRAFERSLYTHYWQSKTYLIFSESRLFIAASNFMDVAYENQLKTFLETQLLVIDSEKIEDTKTQSFYLHTMVLVYDMLGWREKMLIYAEKLFDLLEKNEGFFDDESYCITFCTLMKAYALNKMKVKLFEIAQKFDNIVEENQELKQAYLAGKIQHICIYYNLVIKEIPSDSFHSLMEEYLNDAVSEVKLETYIKNVHYIAVIYFVRNRYKEAQKVLDKVWLKYKVSVENRCFIPINILNILCYFELGNSNIAQRELINFKRKLQRNDLFIPVLKNLVQQLTVILQESTKPTQEPFKQIIQIFEENQERKFFNFYLHFFNFWAKEKIKNTVVL